MLKRRIVIVFALLLALVHAGTAQQESAQQQGADAPAQPDAQQDPQQQPTFRGGINFVRVDVIVTDRKQQPVTDLTEADFELTEDGKPQTIEQFRLIKVDGAAPRPGDEEPKPIRNRDDEEREAGRDDVRIYAILLDDYHVRIENAMSVREPLTRFIQTQVRPQDMITIMYPLTPVSELSFTRDHAAVIRAIQRFEGRKFDYTPRNQFEEQYARYPTETVERIRNDVVMGALRGVAVRLGSLREGRKSIIFVSEGLTAMLPPQMRRADATAPQNPITSAAAAAAQDSGSEMTAEWFGQTDVMSRMRDVYDAANRNNAAIYALDPRGLAPFEYGIADMPIGGAMSFASDRRALQRTQDTLRMLAEETDGRAIVNRNSLAEGLAQIVRDSSFYYLIGYTSTDAPTDGKFHQIKVRVKRSGVDVRARRGYWALTADDAIRATNPTRTPDVAKPIQQALASIAPSVRAGKYVQTWIGTERGENGKTRVTLVWEPLPVSPGTRREQAGRVSLLAADAAGNLIYRGRSPETASPAPTTAPAVAMGAQRIAFDAPPGSVELRLTVEGAGGTGTLDAENRTITVPDFTAPQAAISTPRVYRSRNAREFQAVASDPASVPGALREFSRTERLLIRFSTYGPGTEEPVPAVALLNRGGQKITDVSVAPAPNGATHQIDLSLNSLAPGEYLVEITVNGGGAEAKEYVPLRVTS